MSFVVAVILLLASDKNTLLFSFLCVSIVYGCLSSYQGTWDNRHMISREIRMGISLIHIMISRIVSQILFNLLKTIFLLIPCVVYLYLLRLATINHSVILLCAIFFCMSLSSSIGIVISMVTKNRQIALYIVSLTIVVLIVMFIRFENNFEITNYVNISNWLAYRDSNNFSNGGHTITFFSMMLTAISIIVTIISMTLSILTKGKVSSR